MGDHYTYTHTRNDTGAIFYVGKGKGKRAQSKRTRNERWQRIVKKHGYSIQIVAQFETEEEAFEHEVLLIAAMKDAGVDLCNMTLGGDGARGLPEEALRSKSELMQKHWADPDKRAEWVATAKQVMSSEEVRAKLSAAKLGTKQSPETVAKRVAKNTGKKRSDEFKKNREGFSAGNEYGLGYKHTPEALAKIGAASKERWAKRRALRVGEQPQ